MTTSKERKGFMKKIMVMALTVLLTTFSVACGGDNDDTPNEETIVGKWQLLRYGAPDEGESEASECEQKSTIEFKSDGSFENIFHEEYQGCNAIATKGTWIDKGNNVLETTVDGKKGEGKYVFIEGNLKLISLNNDGSEEEYNIYKKI